MSRDRRALDSARGERQPARPQNIADTADTFMAAVPWGESRMVLIHHRIHGWREYIRLRTWNRHLVKRVWYPSRRFFIIPLQNAEALGHAILAAARGHAGFKPDWLVAREEAEERELELMRELGAPAEDVDAAEEQLEQERRERV